MRKLILAIAVAMALTLSFFICENDKTAYAETAPINVTVTKSDDKISLNWTNVSGNNGYIFYVNGTLTATLDINQNWILLTDYLVEAESYTFGVQTVGLSEDSAITEISYDYYVRYDTPGSLSVSEEKLLSWTGNGASYMVLIDGIKIASGLTETSYSLGSVLSNAKEYTIEVQAEGNGYYVTSYLASITYINTVLLGKPDNLAVSAVDTSVILSWQKVLWATGYVVTVDDGSKSSVSVLNTSKNFANITDNITEIADYTFTVYAVGETNYTNSDSSAYEYSKTATLPAPTLSFSGTTVTWSFDTNAVSYSVSVNGAVKAAELTSGSYDFAFLLVTPAGYTITVQANANGNYLQSPISSITYNYYAQLATPSLTVNNGILSWTAVPNAETYTVTIDDTVFDNLYTGVSIDLTSICGEAKDYNVKVSANATGYYLSSETASVTYQNYATLATTTLDLIDKTIHWQSVVGATTYTVKVDSTTVSAAATGTSMDLTAYLTGSSHVISVFANGSNNYLSAAPATLTYNAASSYSVELSGGSVPSFAAFTNKIYIVGESAVTVTNMTVGTDGVITGSDTSLLSSGVIIFIEQQDTAEEYYIMPSITIGSSGVLTVSETLISNISSRYVLQGDNLYSASTIVSYTYNSVTYFKYYDGTNPINLPYVDDEAEYAFCDYYNPEITLTLSADYVV